MEKGTGYFFCKIEDNLMGSGLAIGKRYHIMGSGLAFCFYLGQRGQALLFKLCLYE